MLARVGGAVGQVVRAMMGPRPELLEDELELELLEEELEELLLDELELLDEVLELLLEEELEGLPVELELLLELELLELLAGSAPQPARPATRLVAKTAAGTKRANGCWRNTNAFMKSSWGYI